MRKICIVIGSRANYSSIKSVMRAVKEHPELTLQVVAGASAILDRYGSVVNVIEQDGFTIDERVYMIVEGETPVTMAQSTGLGLIELARVFDRLKPDVVVTVGDRFETMATAVASAYMNIPLAHTMGGEVTGTIDESVRHAITKLAHIHFPANAQAAERIVKMGELPQHVYDVGCPRMDLIEELAQKHKDVNDVAFMGGEGVGADIDLSKPYLVVMQYPVTTEYGQGEQQIMETLMALEELKIPTIMLWPNADAGSDDVARGMRKFRETYPCEYIRFYKNLPTQVFIPLMMHCACMVGNSSSGIRETSFLGVPAVNIGTRQSGRDHDTNVITCGYDKDEIVASIKKQIAHGKYERSHLYGDGKTGKRIADILATAEVSVQKRLTY